MAFFAAAFLAGVLPPEAARRQWSVSLRPALSFAFLKSRQVQALLRPHCALLKPTHTDCFLLLADLALAADLLAGAVFAVFLAAGFAGFFFAAFLALALLDVLAGVFDLASVFLAGSAGFFCASAPVATNASAMAKTSARVPQQIECITAITFPD